MQKSKKGSFIAWLSVGLVFLFMIWRNTSGLPNFILNLVFAGCITVACILTWGNPIVKNCHPKVLRLARVGTGVFLLQLLLGTLIKQTHSGLACPNFPGCLDSFLPVPFTLETGLAFFHRWLGISMLGLFLHLAKASAKTTPTLARAARHAFGLSLAQVFLGIGTVMTGLHTHSRITHAVVGYALWGCLFYILVRAGGLPWLGKRS